MYRAFRKMCSFSTCQEQHSGLLCHVEEGRDNTHLLPIVSTGKDQIQSYDYYHIIKLPKIMEQLTQEVTLCINLFFFYINPTSKRSLPWLIMRFSHRRSLLHPGYPHFSLQALFLLSTSLLCELLTEGS